MSPRKLLPGWVPITGCIVALVLAFATARAQQPQPAPSGSGSAEPPPSASAAGGAAPVPDPAGSAEPPPSASAASSPPASSGSLHGLHAMFDDEEVPLTWMPPGSSASPLPSEEIFPPQTIALRFNHTLHVKKFGQTCKVCHAQVYESDSAADRALPDPRTSCDNCHDVDHANIQAVKAGPDPNGQCGFCHIGDGAGVGGTVVASAWPRANLRFTHKKHLVRNIGCAQCHGAVEELELATRDQLPRMAGCFTCHAMSGSSAGDAKGECTGCHLTRPSGVMETSFSTGKLVPPPWLHGADHGPDWVMRHRPVAAANSAMCGSCHESKECTDCHDGKVRPRNVHPNDWISMHPQAARQDDPRCVSCHQLQTFCADCHRRVGVARDAPSANRVGAQRFHPPAAVWTTAPRGPSHHAFEAMRNLNACVSCHSERDCATCHAAKGLRGGAGINPHPLGFEASCSGPLQRNPRPCYVCHEPSSSALARCR